MAKILMFSDFHLHNWTYGSSFEGAWNTRLLDQVEIGRQIVDLADLHGVDIVVFCGDLFHTHGRVESGPLKVAADLFVRLLHSGKHKREVYCLVGNHDLGRETNSVDWLRGLGVKVVDDVAVDNEHGLGFAAYADNKPVLDTRLAKLKEHNLSYWFLHQGVQSVPVGSDFVIPNEIFGPSDLPSDEVFEHAFTGHYHNHRFANEKITVIGSPMQFNWSDKNEARGCIVLDTFNNHIFFQHLVAPRFVELDGLLNIRADSDTLHHWGWKEGDETGVDNCFVRVNGEVPLAFMEDIRKKILEGGARSVEFTYKKPLATLGLAREDTFDFGKLLQRYIQSNSVDERGIGVLTGIQEGAYAPAKSSS